MIEDKVVMVLGAGASKPFGLPLGYELLELIAHSLKYEPLKQMEYHKSDLNPFKRPIKDDSKSSNPLFQLLLESGFNKNEIETFAKDLLRSQINSVDAFLEYRTEFIEIGKRAIAYNLLQYEVNDYLLENPDWYKYIWTKMMCPFENFHQNNIVFITFNYDRTLEHFLITSMSSLYGKSKEECNEKLKSIPIIHLHGKLGDLPWQSSKNSIEFGEKIDNSAKLSELSKAIRIIHEDIEDDNVFNEAKNFLLGAQSVCLLGFGFNSKNIKRLGLNELPVQVISTSFGLTELERRQIMELNQNIETNKFMNYNCLEFLRNEFSIK